MAATERRLTASSESDAVTGRYTQANGFTL